MTKEEKAKIRKWARRRWRVSLVVLPIMSALLASLVLLRYTGARGFSEFSLLRSSGRWNTEYYRFLMARPELVAAYAPPAEASELQSWADSLSIILYQPAAIFASDGNSIRWIIKPQGFEAAMDSTETFIAANADLKKGLFKEYGATGVRLKGLSSDTSWAGKYMLVMAERRDDHRRWGIVLRDDEIFPAFYHAIETDIAEKSAPIGSPVNALRDDYALNPSESRVYTGVRAFQNGKLIFASPNLDTTRKVYVYNEGSKGHTKRVEFYLSRLDTIWADFIWLRWWRAIPVALFPMLLLIPFYRWHRKVMLLTEPEPEEQPHE